MDILLNILKIHVALCVAITLLKVPVYYLSYYLANK